MGFIVLGIFSYNVQGQEGAILQMVNHGIIISALFLIVAWISDRTGTRDRSAMAGLAARMPVMAGGVHLRAPPPPPLPRPHHFLRGVLALPRACERARAVWAFCA